MNEWTREGKQNMMQTLKSSKTKNVNAKLCSPQHSKRAPVDSSESPSTWDKINAVCLKLHYFDKNLPKIIKNYLSGIVPQFKPAKYFPSLKYAKYKQQLCV